MKPFKGPAKQRGFLGITAAMAGPLMSGLGGALGGLFGGKKLDESRNDILGLPGMDGPTGVGGNFGQVSPGGQFTGSQDFQNMQGGLATTGQEMLQGGMFNDPRFQQAFQQNDIASALAQANQGFGAQMGNTAFGGMGGLNTILQSRLGQDQTQGMLGNMFNMGIGNMQAAGNQQGLFNQSLGLQRQAAAPQLARQQQALEGSLFSKGLLGAGSSATGEGFRGLFEAQGAQDLAFQNNAFGQAQQQQNFLGNLGTQQMGLGQGFLGQNLNQFNQNVGQQMGLEGQQFGQNLQSLGFNASQGQNRLNSALGLFGQGSDVFNQSFGLGLGAADSFTGMNQFGLSAARTPQELQASLLGAGGQHADALAGLGEGRAGAAGGLFGGLGSAIGGLFG